MLQRQADTERVFDTIHAELGRTRESFPPLMANLKEIGISLRGNLVPARLNAVADQVAKANAQAKEADSHAATIITAIEEITAATGETIAPVKVGQPR